MGHDPVPIFKRTFAFRVSVIPDAVEERPPVFQSPGSLNDEMANHFTFQGFPMQWMRDPMSFEVSIAKMLKWLIISRFEVSRCNG
jgi:hypothetical protein